jgi:ABC-type multidrug transport system ATPase subunit
MEECEALATRLGIMVNGQFKCLGSIQSLKNKFGKGYTLIIKCKNCYDDGVVKVEEFVKSKIAFAKIKGKHFKIYGNLSENNVFFYEFILDKQQETLFYQIEYEQGVVQSQVQTIAELFGLIESNKEALNIETYSLSQTTLEQVFLTFAREQKSLEK